MNDVDDKIKAWENNAETLKNDIDDRKRKLKKAMQSYLERENISLLNDIALHSDLLYDDICNLHIIDSMMSIIKEVYKDER
jgi:hypothetical protein